MSDQQRYWGLYRGFARDVGDPLKLGRLRLQVPEVLGDLLTDWAWPTTMYGGRPNEGAFFIPDRDAGVCVSFEGGDPNRPVWVGSWWGQGETPGIATGEGDPAHRPPKGTDKAKRPIPLGNPVKQEVAEPAAPYAAAYPKNRCIRTASGIVVELDDTGGKERVHVFHPSGSFVEMHPDGKVVVRAAGRRYSVIRGDVRHVSGSDLEHVEGAQESFVEGAATREVVGVEHVLARQGVVLEDGQGHKLSIDPGAGTVKVESAGKVEVVAAGQTSIVSASLFATILTTLTATVGAAMTLTAVGAMTLTGAAFAIFSASGGVMLGALLGVKRRLLDERFLASYALHTHIDSQGGITSPPVPIPMVGDVATADTTAS